MRNLASQFSSEAERKIGWLFKLFFAGTAAAVGYQFFPYMGGAQELLNMLEAARDDRTRKEALKALAAISRSGTHSPSSLDSSSGRKLRTTQSPLQRARIARSPTKNPGSMSFLPSNFNEDISNFKVVGRYSSESFRVYKGETVIAEVNHNFQMQRNLQG